MYFQQPVNWPRIYFTRSVSISHEYFYPLPPHYSLSFLLRSGGTCAVLVNLFPGADLLH